MSTNPLKWKGDQESLTQIGLPQTMGPMHTFTEVIVFVAIIIIIFQVQYSILATITAHTQNHYYELSVSACQ